MKRIFMKRIFRVPIFWAPIFWARVFYFFRVPQLRGFICWLALMGGLTMPAVQAADITTIAQYALVTDFESGRVLLEKNKDAPMKPASMAKIMTVYIVFSQIRDGHVTLDDMFSVSHKARQMGGSRSFLRQGETYSLEELLNGVIVQSGNDAAVAIAEGFSGSEDNFVLEMNEMAQKLGMHNTYFTNATGWPDPDLTTTAADLNLLATRLIKEFPADKFPELYPMFAQKNYTLNGIKQGNRNPLLYSRNTHKGAKIGGKINTQRNIVDGLKTGFTEESGYGLVASAAWRGQRVIMVLNGMDSKKQRAEESRRLMNFIMREFSTYRFFTAGEEVEQADVWLGTSKTVPMIMEADLIEMFSRRERRQAEVKISWVNPVLAPISKGQKLGEATLTVDGKPIKIVPLVAGQAVEELGLFHRLKAALLYLIFGHSAQPSNSQSANTQLSYNQSAHNQSAHNQSAHTQFLHPQLLIPGQLRRHG